MSTKAHYEHHLAGFYAWMSGDFQSKTNAFSQFLKEQHLLPVSSGIAVDLGAGHGMQSIPLAQAGYRVFAVDFNEQLLNELQSNAGNLDITVIRDDLRNVASFARQPELIVCCGDTLAHLDNLADVEKLLTEAAQTLTEEGKLLLTFRDYSVELTGTQRFIPVKSDDNRILTCVLEYDDTHVTVTDLLHERINDAWTQKISSYKKVRLRTGEVITIVKKTGLQVNFNDVVNRMTTIIATKRST